MENMTTDIDTLDLSNTDMWVGAQGEDIVFLKSAHRLSRERALVVAAYIVALTGVDEADFARLLHRVYNT
jgi:hypothetical protein